MHRKSLNWLWWGVIVTIAVCLQSPALAQQTDNTNNAATWYGRAFEGLDRFTPEEIELIENYRATPGAAPSPEVRALINRAAPIIADVMRASSQGYSDFGLDYSQGFDMLLPHLGKMRSLARIVMADSMMHLSDGDGAGAADRISSLYRIADHAGDDRVLISSLVGRAVFEVAEQAAQRGFDRGAFDPASASVLLRATQAFDQRDPFQTLDAMSMEQTLCVSMIRDNLMTDDPEKRDRFVREFIGESGAESRLVGLSQEELRTSLDQYSVMMGRFVEAFAQDDPEVARAQLKEIEAQLEAGEFGVIAQVLTPAFGRVYDLSVESRDKLRARIELLEGITKGQVDLVTLTNAAVWYRRGIDGLNDLEEPWKEAIAALNAHQPLDVEQVAALSASADSAQAAIGQFVDGSNIRRCDFSTERNTLEIFVPRYGAGMRDGFRLLTLEAMRLAATDDVAGATRLLAAGFRMCAHLSDDHLFVSALVARDGFLMLSEAAAGVEIRSHFDEAQRQDLAAAIRRCGTSDPFGFLGATMSAREYLEKELGRWGEPQGVKERQARIAAWLKSLDADGLMYLLAMEDVINYDLTPRDPYNRDGAVQMNEYLLADTAELAAIDAPTFASLVKQGRPNAFEIPETAHLFGVTSRIASARGDQLTTIAWARQRAIESRAAPDPQQDEEVDSP